MPLEGPGTIDLVSNIFNLDPTARAVTDLIAEHGLSQLSATFTKPDAFTDEDAPPVDVLAVVATASPSFVSLRLSRLDAEAFGESMAAMLSGRSKAISDEGRTMIAEHVDRNGHVQDLALTWAADGVVYAYFLVADWCRALEDAVEERGEPTYDDDDEREARRLRARQVVDQLEALREFRAQTSVKRRANGERLLDALMAEGDREPHLPWLDILATAVHLAHSNAEAAVNGVDPAEFAALPEWRATRTQAGRTDLAERLLLERAGYGFVRSAADAFRRRVDVATR